MHVSPLSTRKRSHVWLATKLWYSRRAPKLKNSINHLKYGGHCMQRLAEHFCISLSLSHTHTHTHTHNTTHKCTLWKSADFINVTICYLWFSLEFESLHLQEVHISGSGRSKVCLSFERTYFMYSFLRMFITVILKPVGIFRYLAFAKYTPQYVVRMNMCWPADWPLASQKQLFFTDSRSWVQQREHFF